MVTGGPNLRMARALLFLLLALPASAQSLSRGPIPGEPPAALRDGRARLLAHFTPQQMLRLSIGLSHPHPSEEEQFLVELATPGSPNFHRFLTAREYAARFAPSVSDEQQVIDWAAAAGLTVTQRFANRLIVDLEAPAAVIERALGVTLNTYQLENYLYFANQREPAIPSHLSAIVHSIGGLNNFPAMHPAGRPVNGPPGPVYLPGPVIGIGHSRGADGDPSRRTHAHTAAMIPEFTNGWLDPQNIYSSSAYNYDGLQNFGLCCNPLAPGSSAGSPYQSSIALATYGNLHWDGSQFPDIEGFQNIHPYLAYNITTVPIDGGTSACVVTAGQPCNNDSETALDAEWSSATANSFGNLLDTAHVWVYESSGNAEDMYNTILSDGHARVFSTSWSCTELYGCSASQMETDHGIFDAMAAQGWTMMASAGDTGSTNDCIHVSVGYPSADPDVIAVGGTFLSLFSDGTYNYETAWTGGADSNSCATNNGGGAGGCSAQFTVPSYQSGSNGTCGNQRSVPDIALNAANPEDYYFNGAVSGIGGTSISSPMLAGFFAQANAYLLYIGNLTGNNCGSNHVACAPIGWGAYFPYYFGLNPGYAPHYPFYDITAGCNSNDITAAGNLQYFCAGVGYDQVTGWGSANMLQFSWALNTYLAGDFGPPSVSFSGIALDHWYTASQIIDWTIADTSANGANPTGVAGYSSKWDADPGDDIRLSTPGIRSAYYSGPAWPLATAGSTPFNGSTGGEGCHFLHVRAWDNAGATADNIFGPVCYDDVPPSLFCNAPDSLWHASDVSISCTAGDTYSGLAKASDASFSLTTSVPPGTETSSAVTNSHTVFDVAGNSATAGPIGAIKVDKKPPVIAVTQPAAASYSAGDSLTLSYSVTDNGSGVAAISATLNGSATASGVSIPLAGLPLGDNIFSLVATDHVGNRSSASVIFTVTPRPVLSLAITAASQFLEGQTNAVYTVTVTNAASAGPTSGLVTVTENVPQGLTLASMTGSGWTCPGTAANNCTRSDVLMPGSSYDALTVAVNVAGSAPPAVINQASLSGGAAAPVTSSRLTGIAGVNSCDVMRIGTVNAAAVQALINQVLGTVLAVNDVNGDGLITVADIQIEINAAMGRGCTE